MEYLTEDGLFSIDLALRPPSSAANDAGSTDSDGHGSRHGGRANGSGNSTAGGRINGGGEGSVSDTSEASASDSDQSSVQDLRPPHLKHKPVLPQPPQQPPQLDAGVATRPDAAAAAPLRLQPAAKQTPQKSDSTDTGDRWSPVTCCRNCCRLAVLCPTESQTMGQLPCALHFCQQHASQIAHWHWNNMS